MVLIIAYCFIDALYGKRMPQCCKSLDYSIGDGESHEQKSKLLQNAHDNLGNSRYSLHIYIILIF